MRRADAEKAGKRAARVPFRAIADATYDWESWLARDGKLLWVNPAVFRITGHDVAESLAMDDYPLPLVVAEDRPKIERILASARGGSSGNDVEFRVLRKDGTPRWAAISWQSFEDDDGNSLGFRTSVRDIDERKRSERRLRDALIAAERAAESRQSFLANTSHELRTPLQSILGYAQLLTSDERDPEKLRKLEIVVQQTESLLAIVSNVLEMAALQVKAPEIVEEDFDVREKVASVLESVHPLATGKRLELRLQVDDDVPRRVRGDRLRLRQILTNLIANAIKFSERGHVEVRVARAPRGRIRFSVEDTGIGIAKQDLAQLFTPFTRAGEASRRGIGGTGLGLSIAKALTDAMGGTLRVRSRQHVGSRFTLELPLAPVERVASPRAPGLRERHGGDRGDRLRVLVVDDGPAARDLVCEMLRGLGADASAAASGEEAVHRIPIESPDLVLMDLQMPGLDGATTAQLIRAQASPDAPRPRIVALTANAFARADALGPAGGMDGYLVKPARLADLRALLERVRSELGDDDVTPLLGGAHPPVAGEVLDRAVLEDLAAAHGRDGRTLLAIAGQRILEETPRWLRELGAALEQETIRADSPLAHRVKGNCLLVGAATAAELAQHLEDAMARDAHESARALLHQLTDAFAELERVLRPMVTRGGAPPARPALRSRDRTGLRARKPTPTGSGI